MKKVINASSVRFIGGLMLALGVSVGSAWGAQRPPRPRTVFQMTQGVNVGVPAMPLVADVAVQAVPARAVGRRMGITQPIPLSYDEAASRIQSIWRSGVQRKGLERTIRMSPWEVDPEMTIKPRYKYSFPVQKSFDRLTPEQQRLFLMMDPQLESLQFFQGPITEEQFRRWSSMQAPNYPKLDLSGDIGAALLWREMRKNYPVEALKLTGLPRGMREQVVVHPASIQIGRALTAQHETLAGGPGEHIVQFLDPVSLASCSNGRDVVA